MKNLVLRPPQVLSYFNAGHHIPLYQVAAHLRRTWRDRATETVDGTMGSFTWKDLADLLYQNQYRFIFMQIDLDGTDGVERCLRYIRELSPSTEVIAFGRLSGLNPNYVARFDLDAIVAQGDFEAGCVEAAELLERGDQSPGHGVRLRTSEGGLKDPHLPGIFMDPEDWILPDPSDIPYEQYAALYSRDSRRFSGIPDLKELVVPVSRGCPIGCSFCEVPAAFGRKDRRLTVARVVEYIDDCFSAHDFDYISFYAPTFTIDRQWVVALSRRLSEGPARRWKCCTTIHHLDEDLVSKMAASGCFRISVGVETFDEGSESLLPRIKQNQKDKFLSLASWCSRFGIELNCFVMVGLPGSRPEKVRETVDTIHDAGGRVRPTVYSPYDELAPGTTYEEGLYVNRQLLQPSLPLDQRERQQSYELAYGPPNG